MRGFLFMSYVVFFVRLNFAPLAMTHDHFAWVPTEQKTPSAQCTGKGKSGGSCQLSSLYKNTHRMGVARCKHLLCAKRRGDQYIAESIGPAAVGTLCDVNKVCNEKQQCVEIPENKVPMFIGTTKALPCIHESEDDRDE